MTDDDRKALVEARNLVKHFPVQTGFLSSLLNRGAAPAVKAVDGVSFTIRHGDVFGLAGESGSGKSTIGRLVLRLLEPTSGQVHFAGQELGSLGREEMRRMRSRMQIVFQDPFASLNPRMTIGQAVSHPAEVHRPDLTAPARKAAVMEMLAGVGMSPPSTYYDKYPHQVSGGQRQRVVIARALMTRPSLIVADEPLAMADVSVRALLLDLMLRLKREFDLTYLFITHDLATAKYVCNRIAVMYLGRIVEIGPLDNIYGKASHPYTQALLDAIPVPDPRHRRTQPMPHGEIPSAIDPPPGCSFHPRCPIAEKGICDRLEPELRPVPGSHPEHLAACHLRTGDYQHLDRDPAAP